MDEHRPRSAEAIYFPSKMLQQSFRNVNIVYILLAFAARVSSKIQESMAICIRAQIPFLRGLSKIGDIHALFAAQVPGKVLCMFLTDGSITNLIICEFSLAYNEACENRLAHEQVVFVSSKTHTLKTVYFQT